MAPAVVFDAIMGGLLTWGLYRRTASYKTKMPLATLIIQDGLLYFAVVFTSNILWLLVHALGSDSLVGIHFSESWVVSPHKRLLVFFLLHAIGDVSFYFICLESQVYLNAIDGLAGILIPLPYSLEPFD